MERVDGSDASVVSGGASYLFPISGFVDAATVVNEDLKIDYSGHGAGWSGQCNSGSTQQSPLNLNWETAQLSVDIRFELLYRHRMSNATVSIQGDGSLIKIDYPNELDNEIRVFNELAEDQTYYLSHMLWKVPSEHTIDNRQLSAEL